MKTIDAGRILNDTVGVATPFVTGALIILSAIGIVALIMYLLFFMAERQQKKAFLKYEASATKRILKRH